MIQYIEMRVGMEFKTTTEDDEDVTDAVSPGSSCYSRTCDAPDPY